MRNFKPKTRIHFAFPLREPHFRKIRKDYLDVSGKVEGLKEMIRCAEEYDPMYRATTARNMLDYTLSDRAKAHRIEKFGLLQRKLQTHPVQRLHDEVMFWLGAECDPQYWEDLGDDAHLEKKDGTYLPTSFSFLMKIAQALYDQDVEQAFLLMQEAHQTLGALVSTWADLDSILWVDVTIHEEAK